MSEEVKINLEESIAVFRSVVAGELARTVPEAKTAAKLVKDHVSDLKLPCIVIGTPARHDLAAALVEAAETRTNAHWLALAHFAGQILATP